MSEIKVVIFDFFDVVHGDPQKAWLRENGLERAGVFAEASDNLDTNQISLDEYYQLYATGHGSKTPEEVRAEFKEIAKIDPDTVAIIKKLRSAKYVTALVSNTTTDEIGPILDEHELRPLFDAIIISSEVGIRKPNPAIFELILKELGVEANETLFVDDTLDNVEAAVALGIGGIHHTDAANLEKQLASAGVHLG